LQKPAKFQNRKWLLISHDNQTMKAYSNLTPLGQARRLRPLAMDAIRHYNLDATRLRLVSNDMNGIFRIDTRDGRKYILRITLPEGGHTLDHVTAEMDWLAALARDTDLSIPRPLPTRNGSLVVEASAEGVPELRFCAIFSWVPGKNLIKSMTEENFARLGELMARLHGHALSYHPPAGLSLLQYDRVFPYPEPVVLFDEANAHFFTPERRKNYEDGIAWVQESIDRLVASGEPNRILHGDLHQWNVRLSQGILSPIDFEDLILGWPVQDIAISFYYYFRNENYTALRAAFQAGYSSCSPWPERHPGEIDSFIAGRGIGLANFIINDPNLEWRNQAAEFIQKIELDLQRLMSRQG
jgi:Ser/Thr protein kinase RdoA (MazF antagonist)